MQTSHDEPVGSCVEACQGPAVRQRPRDLLSRRRAGSAGLGPRAEGLTLPVLLGLWDLPPGRHVLDHPRLRGPVLLRLRQWVPLHVLSVSPHPDPWRPLAPSWR